jgi:hypothetical protein
VSLKGLIDNTNLPIIVGTFVGWEVAQPNAIMLFITVPAGIVAVSSAIGIGRALQNGLNKVLSRLFG